MRVISGKYKGKKLIGFDKETTRPTMDRVKESLFGIIQNELKEAIFLDLFAGSGAIAIEALSNGAKEAYLVEKDREMANIIKKNIEGISNTKLLNYDYIQAIKKMEEENIIFDIIFLDPPYNLNLINESLNKINNLVKKDTLIICEYENEKINTTYEIIKEKKYGNKNIKILRVWKMNIFSEKLSDVTKSILPIFSIVLLLNLIFKSLNQYLFEFIASSIMIIIGFTLFLVGVELGISPLGKKLSSFFATNKKVIVIIVISFLLGFFISLAEPSLVVLSNRIEFLSNGGIESVFILFVIAMGIGISMIFGLFRTLLNIPLYIILIVTYIIIFILSTQVSPEVFAIAFDASGATTGVITVPFMLALAIGLSISKKDSKMGEKDSFGLIAIASAGAVISFLIIGIFKNFDFKNSVEAALVNNNIIDLAKTAIKDSSFGIMPIIVIFIALNLLFFKLSKKDKRRIIFGLSYSLIGLFLFLLGVNYGFMPVASMIGKEISSFNNTIILLTSFIFGFLIMMAEPAIHVLTDQVEEVTSGYIRKKTVLAAISVGGGLAVLLAVLKLLYPEITLFMILSVGYSIALLLTLIAPKLFVGIAFDAGGVATGPMTATFIFAFIEGISITTKASLISTLGMISLVALAPIITVQLLGLLFSIKSKKSGGAING